eukprot:CAMPEP_0202980576 /NCGR_PEP_ID=MMETSP1396-20130829/86482_1 /ASSEMBLY_ACC=CAM_ASM_000872 /TAXON_ID= /ORGANISM="Pseudokeronopsis sp., Strain Brazil" /LENGTH=66 /DNA_ID=CAMNT_0049720651 /DNA_START=185 /DNA_END=385 /DNA_ORIENTATION=-
MSPFWDSNLYKYAYCGSGIDNEVSEIKEEPEEECDDNNLELSNNSSKNAFEFEKVIETEGGIAEIN